MRPFNLHHAIAGRPCAHVSGAKVVRIAYFPEAATYSQVVVVLDTGGVATYSVDGCGNSTEEPYLVMIDQVKARREFSLEAFQTGAYNVITVDGQRVNQLTLFVDCGHFDLAGVVDGKLTIWSRDGDYVDENTDHYLDLRLEER